VLRVDSLLKRRKALLQLIHLRRLGLKRFDLRILGQQLLVLLDEFIQEHGVHRLVTHSVNAVLLVAHHLVGGNLVHLLGYQAKLRNAIGINFRLVMERYWFQRQ